MLPARGMALGGVPIFSVTSFSPSTRISISAPAPCDRRPVCCPLLPGVERSVTRLTQGAKWGKRPPSDTSPEPFRSQNSRRAARVTVAQRGDAAVKTVATDETRRALDAIAAAAEAGDEARFRTLLWSSRPLLGTYLTSFRVNGANPDLAMAYVGDALYRFLHTLELVPLPQRGRILEIGSNPYFFHLLLKKIFPKAELVGSNFFSHDIFSTELGTAVQRLDSESFDETHEFSSVIFNLETIAEYPFPEDAFDLVFFCETLEHLVVNPLATFGRLRRILRPGGHLLITLPNAVRLSNVALMLDGYNFFDLYQEANGVHGRHNREYTLQEMSALLLRNGFEVSRAETHDRYDYDQDEIGSQDYTGVSERVFRTKKELLELLNKVGGKTEDRGDNLYLLGRKARPAGGNGASDVDLGGSVPRLVTEPSSLKFFVDVFEDLPNSLSMAGWAFAVPRSLEGADEELVVVLESAAGSYERPCARLERPDVAAAFGLGAIPLGFHVDWEKTGMAPGRYRVVLRGRRDGEEVSALTNYVSIVR